MDAAYLANGGRRSFATDAGRVAFLVDLYQRCTNLLPADNKKTGRVGRAKRMGMYAPSMSTRGV